MISFILWTLLGCLIGGVVGSALGNLISPVGIFIFEILEAIPIPVFLSRLILSVGTSALVYFLCESRFWFGLIVIWWILCFIWTNGGDEVKGL